jgi:GTP cyclohydrolase I
VIDRDGVRRAVEGIIAAIGEDPTREGLADTPTRIGDMYAEIFSGLSQDPKEILAVAFEEEEHEEMVVLRDIPFYSMCEHHFLPFHGLAHVGYIPRRRLVGISKLARVVEILARRPQLQERLTGQIADTIVDALGPRGVGVVIEAEHLCMTMRGIRKPGSRLVTSANRGIFRTRPDTRAEFFSILEMAESAGR